MRDELTELADISSRGSELTKKVILEKLTFLMSDRAPNKKLANQYINEWRKEELGEESQPIIALYCMAHTLLGFMKHGMGNILEFQQSLIAESGVKLGRDAYSEFAI